MSEGVFDDNYLFISVARPESTTKVLKPYRGAPLRDRQGGAHLQDTVE